MSQIDEEGTVLIGFDEGLRRRSLGVFTFATFGVGGLGVGVAGVVRVKALFQRAEPLATDVPLSNRGGNITGRLEILGNHFLLQRHLHLDFRMKQFLRNAVGPPRQKCCEMQAGGRLASQNGGT